VVARKSENGAGYKEHGLELSGKIALVTGGGTGLGYEVSLGLAAKGATIAVAYSRSHREAEETVAAIRSAGGSAASIQADLSTTAGCEAIIRETAAAFGRLDILVHNAATTRFVPFPDLDAISEDDWDAIFDLNLRSAFFLARAAAPLLKETEGGIIFTSSIAGLAPGGSSVPYAVSKAGLIHLTKCLAKSLAPKVRVNTVAPGLVMTRWVAGFPEERLQQFQEAALLKRASDLKDAAAAFVMLACNNSITGQTIVVDAGQLMS